MIRTIERRDLQSDADYPPETGLSQQEAAEKIGESQPVLRSETAIICTLPQTAPWASL
jgi:hypothetical protein